MTRRTTALIADDEPLLRKQLARLLAAAWPELEVVANARNGREAVEQFEAKQPDVCFLDVHMPGVSGVEAARYIGRRAQLVFVTAFDRYAVEAFRHGALDYLVKPVEAERLAETVARLQERLDASAPPPGTDALIERIAAQLRKDAKPAPLRWLRVSVGNSLRLVAVEDVDFLKSDEKYTLVAWRGDGGRACEGVVRTPLKDLLAQLDPGLFAQVHRSVVVNLRAIAHVVRGDNETAQIHLKARDELLPVSRAYLHLFKQM
ncbi:MAG TPA: LytTR family DNA-binding domain-containing protein [Xanthomonadales bacterium]|nr:LytTR family DNA-binding domain-containing protein [Xanthomonadales bacterium]